MGIRFPNRVGLAAGLDKNAAHLDGPRHARLRLPRSRHGHAARAARQSEAAHVPPRRSARRSSTGWASTTTASTRFVANVDALAATAACSASTSARTSTRRTSAPPTTTSRACAPCHARASYVTINVSSPNTKGLRDLQAEAALTALLARLDGRARRARAAARPPRAARGQDRARPRRRRRARGRAAARHASDRRRHRDQHDARARRRRRACRTPTKPAACPARRCATRRRRSLRDARARARRRAADHRRRRHPVAATTRRRRSTPARRSCSSTPGSSTAARSSSRNALARWRTHEAPVLAPNANGRTICDVRRGCDARCREITDQASSTQ